MTTHSEQPILVGVDYSENSIQALRRASSMAESKDGNLVVFHILDEEIIESIFYFDSKEVYAVLDRAYEKLNAVIDQEIGSADTVETVIVIGHPFVEIMKLVEKYDPFLLVLGSHGHSSKSYDQVGSLASKCVRKAPTEVLLVRETQEEPFKTIVACIDFSENSFKAARRAAEIAQKNEADLHLIHIHNSPTLRDVEMGWLGPALPIRDKADLKNELEEKIQKFSTEISSSYTLKTITTHIYENHHNLDGIYQCLKEVKAELCVLCTRGRTGLKSLLLGTTAEKIINISPCSTLVVKPKGFTYELK